MLSIVTIPLTVFGRHTAKVLFVRRQADSLHRVSRECFPEKQNKMHCDEVKGLREHCLLRAVGRNAMEDGEGAEGRAPFKERFW